MESYWNDFFGEGGGACVAMERSLRRSSELLLADWYWFSRLPCADFWCPEGRRLIMLCYWKGTEKTSVGHKAFRNPFIGLLLRLCNDIETNPGPPNPPRRRSKPRRYVLIPLKFFLDSNFCLEILDLCKDKGVEQTRKQVTVIEVEEEDGLDLVVKHLPSDLTILKI